jgi:hypothetical protein
MIFGLCPLLRGQEYHASIWESVADPTGEMIAVSQQCKMTLMAPTGPAAMSAVQSLSGDKRTLRG